MSCSERESLGAYVLGALDGVDQPAVERHLGRCTTCREELLRLAPLPGLLSRITPDEFTEPDTKLPGADPLPAGEPTKRRDPRRALAAAAAAAVLGAALAALLVGTRVVPDAAPTPAATATWSTPEDAGEVGATAQLTARAWGTDLRLAAHDLPARERCRLVVIAADGRTETAGWWTSAYQGSVDLRATTSVDLDAIDHLEVRAGTQLLAVLHPPG